jgi:hypothetical protein
MLYDPTRAPKATQATTYLRVKPYPLDPDDADPSQLWVALAEISSALKRAPYCSPDGGDACYAGAEIEVSAFAHGLRWNPKKLASLIRYWAREGKFKIVFADGELIRLAKITAEPLPRPAPKVEPPPAAPPPPAKPAPPKIKGLPRTKDEARVACAEAAATHPITVVPARPEPRPRASPSLAPAPQPKRQPPKLGLARPGSPGNVVVHQIEKLQDALAGDGAAIADNASGRRLIVMALNAIYRQALSLHAGKSLPKRGWHRAAMTAFLDRRAPWADDATRCDLEFDAYEIAQPPFTKYQIAAAFGADIDEDVANMIEQLGLTNIAVPDPSQEANRRQRHAQAMRQWRARQPRRCAARGCRELIQGERSSQKYCSDKCKKRAWRTQE